MLQMSGPVVPRRKVTNMKIEFSTNEYRDLLDILHIADLVMSGHRKEEDKRTERHRSLLQKLYALAAGEGLDRLISFNASANKYVPTGDFEQSTPGHTVIREFEEHLFWDQLIFRLTERDAAQIAGGTDHLIAMNESDRRHVEGTIRQRYIEEFATNGVTNLTVIEQFPADGEMPVETSD